MNDIPLIDESYEDAYGDVAEKEADLPRCVTSDDAVYKVLGFYDDSDNTNRHVDEINADSI